MSPTHVSSPTKDIDWDNLRNVTPPYQPKVSGPDDTSNFDTDELRPPNNNAGNSLGPSNAGSKDSLIHLPFVGFTSTLSSDHFNNNIVTNASLINGANELTCDASGNVYNHVIVNHKNNVTVIERIDDEKLNTSPTSSSSTPADLNQTNQHETLNKLECDLRTARQEWSEVTAKLGEMRKEKSSLSSRLRCKEEEIEQQLEKNNDLRQQLRNAERFKRQLLDQIVDLQTELAKERNIRNDGESFCLLFFSFFFFLLPFVGRKKRHLLQPLSRRM